MATEKKITSRIQQKHDVAANWAKATNFIPKKGEIIIYEAEYNTSGVETQPVRFKIGDGSKTVGALPFAVIDYSNDIETLEQEVADNSTAIGALQGNTVPKTRKINNKELSSDITLGASDVGVTETAFPGLKKTGTVTGVKMNGTTKNPSSGIVDLGTVITEHQSLDGKQDKLTSSNKLSALLVSGLADVATTGSYNDLSNTPTIPSAVTSIDGLGGGTLTSPLKITGGDGSAAAKISLNQSGNGQITDSSTGTLFGFMSSTTLTVGDNSYALALRGSGARPTYKGADLALKSDIPSVPTNYVTTDTDQTVDGAKSFTTISAPNGIKIGDNNTVYGAGDSAAVTQFLPAKDGTFAMTSDIPDVSGKANLLGGNTFNGTQEIQIDSTTAGTEKFIVNDAADGLELINATASSGLALPEGFKTSGAIDCQQGATIGDFNGFLALDYSNINHPVLSISDGAVVDLDGDKGTAGQVFTSSGDGTAPTWTTPAIKSATLTGTTLYLTL